MGTEAGRRVADELRDLIELSAAGDHDDTALATAAGLLAEARTLLDGPRRSRWYELVDPTDPEAVARSYARQSPFRGTENALAPPLVLEKVHDDQGFAVIGRVRLSSAYEGPPRGVHGGMLAGLFDDVLGAAQRLSGTRGVTARLTVRYREITPLDTDLVFRAGAEEARGRRVACHATCHADGVLTAEAEALFVGVDFGPSDEEAS